MQTGISLLAVFTTCLTVGMWKHVETPVRIPLLAHNLPWIVSLGVAGSGLILYARVSPYAIGLMSVGILSFNLGTAMGGRSRGGETAVDRQHVPLLSFKQYVALWVIFLLGTAELFLTINRLFGWRALVFDSYLIRQYSDVSYLQQFPLWGKFAFYLGPLIFALTMNSRTVSQLSKFPRWVRWLLLGLLVTAQSIALQRTNIFVGLILGLALLLFGQFQERRRKGIGGRALRQLALSGVVALGVFLVIGGATGTSGSALGDTPYVSPALSSSGLSSPLLYGSSGPVAFGRLTESTLDEWPALNAPPPLYGDYNPTTWGAASFQAVLKIVPIARLWPQIGPFTNIPVVTNVYTWLEPWYRDYRVAGVVFFPFLIGQLASRAAIRSSLSQGDQLLAALFVACILWAPFTNRFIDVMSIELFILAWWWRRASNARVRDHALSVT